MIAGDGLADVGAMEVIALVRMRGFRKPDRRRYGKLARDWRRFDDLRRRGRHLYPRGQNAGGVRHDDFWRRRIRWRLEHALREAVAEALAW